MVVIILTTHWTEDYWYKNGKAPYTKYFEPLKNIPKQEYRAIGVYTKGKLKGEPIDRSHLKPSFLQVSGIRHHKVSGHLIVSYQFLNEKLDMPSKVIYDEIRSLDRFRGERFLPLCFYLEDDEWQAIREKLNIDKVPDGWQKLAEVKTEEPWLGNYFMAMKNYDWRRYEQAVSACFHVIGFRVNALGYRREEERVPDGYLYTPLGLDFPKEDSFWVTYDCKSRKNYPSSEDDVAKDERAMVEYIQDHEKIVSGEGIIPSNKFFLFVAHGFHRYAVEMCKKISNKTKAMGALLTTDTLLYLTSKRLKTGYRFRVLKLSELFNNAEITVNDIDRAYSISDEITL